MLELGTMEDESKKRAEEILEAYVENLAPGEEIDVEALCNANPEYADQLRSMVESWNELLGVLDGLSASPRTVTGKERELRSTITLEPKPDVPQDSNSIEIIERLQKRIGIESRYEVLGEFARGGMGAILRVWDRDLRRTLAMKVVLGKQDLAKSGGSSAAEEKTLGRFVEEAQVTGQLDHPGIVPVYELGVDNEGQVFFTMRLVKGIELSKVFEYAREGKEGWTQTRAVGAILKVCETMAYAHSKGVIHRDLKPANIMVGRFGEVYVMDWGLARAQNEGIEAEKEDSTEKESTGGTQSSPKSPQSIVRTDLREGNGSGPVTMDGEVMGTPAYMSPEQARGNLSELGSASDTYSMGAILYHLLAGHMPFAAPGSLLGAIEIWGRLNAGPPPPLAEIAPNRPAELVAICERAMARAPKDRYATMGEMAEDLYAYVEGHVVLAYESGRRARIRKWISRNKALSASLLGLLVLSIASVGGFIGLQSQALAAVSQARDDARRESYVAGVVAADASLRAREIQQAKRLLAEAREELRGWEWRHLDLRSDTSLRRLEGHSGSMRALSVSLDGSLLASASEDGKARVWDMESGRQLMVLPEPEDVIYALAFHGTDKELLTLEGSRGWTDGHLRTWNATTGELIGAIELAEAPTGGAAISEDQRWLAYGAADGFVSVVDLENQVAVQSFVGHEDIVHAVAFVGADRVLSASEDGTVRLWNLGSEQELIFRGHEDAVYSIAVSPAGDSFVSASADGTLRRWSIEEDSSGEILFQEDASANAVVYATAGELIVSAWSDKMIRVLEPTSQRLAEYIGHDQDIRCLLFNAHSELLISGGDDAALRIWDLKRSEAVQTIPGTEYVSALALDPQAERLAIGSGFAGSVRIVDADTGNTRCVLGKEIEYDEVNDLAFSSGGELLAAAHLSYVRVYRIADRQRIHEIPHSGAVSAVAFHPKGLGLVSGSRSVKLWDEETGKLLREFGSEETEILDLAFCPTGEFLAAALGGGGVRVWNFADGAEVGALPELPGGAFALGWKAAGEALAIAAGDNTIHLWQPKDGRSQVLSGHERRVTSIVFKAGARMFSASLDGTIRVWDMALEAPEMLLALRDHANAVTSLAISPDGERLFSGSQDDTVRVWRASEKKTDEMHKSP